MGLQDNERPNRWSSFGFVGLWLGLAVLSVVVAFQIHTTLVYVGLRAVELPAVNRMGWNTFTIRGLARFLWLVIGIAWLVTISVMDDRLRDGHRRRLLVSRGVRLALILGGIYGLCYLVLLMLG